MLKELKCMLRITWNTEDEYLNDVLSRAKAYVEALLGIKFKVNETLTNRQHSLIINCARYDYNNALELFKENFRDDILSAQLEAGINEQQRTTD